MALIRVYNKDTGNFDIYYNSNDMPNLENYYTKNEIDIMLENLEVDVDLSNYYTKLQIDNLLNNKLNLSDVYSWAKQPNKPSYTYGEVGAAPANHTHPEYYTEAMINTRFAGLGYDSALQKLRYDTGQSFPNVATEEWVSANFNKYTHPSYTPRTSGFYKITVDGSGHVSAVSSVSKSDITALGIPAQDTVYTHPSTHPISMISGLQSALDSKLGTSGTAYNSTRWNGYRIRTGSGLSGLSGYITFSY